MHRAVIVTKDSVYGPFSREDTARAWALYHLQEPFEVKRFLKLMKVLHATPEDIRAMQQSSYWLKD